MIDRLVTLGLLAVMAAVLFIVPGAGAAVAASGCNVEASAGWSAAKATMGGQNADDDGALFGVGAGCDMALPQQNWIVGALARYDWIDYGIDGQWSLAARVGYEVQPGFLAYALTGASFADIGGTRTAWLLGLGVERDLGQDLGLRIEYDYNKFNDLPSSSDLDEHTVRLAFVYKFPSLIAPVVDAMPAAPIFAPAPPAAPKPLK